MKRTRPLTRRTPLARGEAELSRETPMKRSNPKRRAKEWARAYGSLERVYYVSEHLACAVPSCIAMGPMENAHTETGGMGRKADADKVIPLCHDHHVEHHAGAETFALAYGVDLESAAAGTEYMWRVYGADVVARAKADGRFQRFLEREDAT